MGLLHIVANDKHAILSYRTNKRLNKILFYYTSLKKFDICFLFIFSFIDSESLFWGGKHCK